MTNIAFSKEIKGTVEEVCPRVEAAIGKAGFGLLSRIELDQKFQEKLGEKIPRTTILGACNPKLAFEVYRQTTDVALLVPCNVVVRETRPGFVMVEAMRPSQMLGILPAVKPAPSFQAAEEALKAAIDSL